MIEEPKKPLNIIYSRVSKENETEQDLEVQEAKLIEKFNIKDPKILTERGSAYKIKNLKKRTEFLRIIRYAFSSRKITLDDVWLRNYEKKPVNLYVWDTSRLMRNIEYSLLFQLLSDLFDLNIYTYKDGKLKENDGETPSKKLLRYMVMSIHAFSGEEYSYTTSENIKKAFHKEEDGFSYSRDGNKVGRKRSANYDKILELHKKGMKLSHIAKKLGCNKSSVFNAIKLDGVKQC